MYKDLLSHSPLLALPLFALFVFLVVFVAVVARTMAKKPREYDQAAALPLSEENSK